MDDFVLLGIIYSSGSIKWGKNYKLELQTNRPEFAEIFYQQICNIGSPKIKKEKTIVVSLAGKNEINSFLVKIGIYPPIDKENIPLQILETSEKRQSFLKGFFEGKSSIYPKKKLIRISGKTQQLSGIKTLLDKEHVRSGIYSTGKYKSLYIEGKARCETFRKIGFVTKEKNRLLDQIVFFEKAGDKDSFKAYLDED
jgi:DNA-binding transcriptional regulator WhiA